MREIRGTYLELTAKSYYDSFPKDSYLHITLTDEEDVLDAVGGIEAYRPVHPFFDIVLGQFLLPLGPALDAFKEGARQQAHAGRRRGVGGRGAAGAEIAPGAVRGVL
jgi:hypothetical protein